MYEYNSTNSEDKPLEDLEPVHPPPRGWTWISWLAILTFVGFICWMQNRSVPAQAAVQPLQESALANTITQLRMRVAVGTLEITHWEGENFPAAELEELYTDSAGDESVGSFGQRLQRAVLANEILGADEALQHLATLEILLQQEDLQPSAEQNELRQILGRLFLDYSQEDWTAPSVPEAQRQILREKLGWSGELALAPRETPDVNARQAAVWPAWRTIITLGIGVGTLLIIGGLGLIGLLAYSVMSLSGSIRTGIGPPRDYSGIYAETFALWLFWMLAIDFLMIVITRNEAEQLAGNLIGNLCSLIVLVWPMFRGVEWNWMLSDLGLNWGRRGMFEIGFGFLAYAMTLPLLAVGVALMFLAIFTYNSLALAQVPSDFPMFLASAFTPDEAIAAHPIVQYLTHDPWMVAMVFVLAVIAAPVLEEIMFRGVLYRQLRDGSRWLPPVLSVLFSTLTNAALFAAIHPQGVFAIPPLVGLACGMTLAREWRGSLIAPITCHALNNGLVLSLALIILN